MSNLDKANSVAHEWVESMGGLEAIRHDHGSDLSGLIQALDDAGLLAPDVQIIRTFPELEALDPETVLIPPDGHACTPRVLLLSNRIFGLLPAAVIATGAQVRAAREAMEVINE